MTAAKKRVLVVGGGAAGMAAAYFAAEAGADVILIEKNEKLGKKLYITGKGRCNVTNDSDLQELLQNVVSNGRFLYSAVSGFGQADVMRWIEGLGTPLKTERGSRVFPVSDHASDILRALERGLSADKVKIRLCTEVQEILRDETRAAGVLLKGGEKVPADAVIVATGGLSYPSTGSTGDGFAFAEAMSHTVTPLRPALVPLTAQENYISEMEGLSLRNVRLTIPYGKKKKYSEFGEMLFTADGISGPLGLRASSVIGKELEKGPLSARIDLKPALSEEQLDARILRLFSESTNRSFKNAVRPLFPASLWPVIVRLSGISENKPVHEVTKKERQSFITLIKAFPLTLNGTHGYREAVITQGGVSIKEISPSTMESKKCRGLFFAGEVLDLDAFTGGFNLQIAWSTGHCAGIAAAESEHAAESCT